jgi:hypothetical protein
MTDVRTSARVLVFLLPVAAVFLYGVSASAQDHPWAVTVLGGVTTSSVLYPNASSADPTVRAESFQFGSAFGVGAELSYSFTERHIAVGASFEYVSVRGDRSLNVIGRDPFPVSDGYRVIPVELTGYFVLPFSGERFTAFMGGGGGLYIGWRTLSFGNVDAAPGALTPGAGIHVLAGARYSPLRGLAFLGEMKFRDLQFRTTNRFDRTSITVNGTTFTVAPETESRIHTDGVMFQIGVMVQW